MAHNERCRACKETIKAMLERIYGSVIPNHRVPLATHPDGYMDTPFYSTLKDIYQSLQQHRGFEKFTWANWVDVDFFIPDPGFVVEFDESQHFTKPRMITLDNYPASVQVEYPIPRWRELCTDLNRRDNDPAYRDEQRSWYDTLRDFLPEIKGHLPTVRLYAREMVWCELNPENPGDVARFRELLEKKRMHALLPEYVDLPVQDKNPEWRTPPPLETSASKEPGSGSIIPAHRNAQRYHLTSTENEHTRLALGRIIQSSSMSSIASSLYLGRWVRQ
jgi:hypothetical protein